MEETFKTLKNIEDYLYKIVIDYNKLLLNLFNKSSILLQLQTSIYEYNNIYINLKLSDSRGISTIKFCINIFFNTKSVLVHIMENLFKTLIQERIKDLESQKSSESNYKFCQLNKISYKIT